MEPEITLTDAPSEGAIDSIGQPLTRFNEVGSGRPNDYRPLALLVSDPRTKEILGGLSGWTSFSVLHIELLYLPQSLRGSGLGRRLIQQAEEEAIRRSCVSAWLDTFSFQAPGFYQRLGYEVFGVIEDYPPGYSRYFLKKKLATRSEALPPAEFEPLTTKDTA
jgi:GNAT superfamily N-acetyltransferase